MDIVSRLKMFLSQKNITSSQFADACDIPRPTVSQLLNGRNKKVSDEVISKIHSSYPELSIMWLMFGEEPMLIAASVPNANNEDATMSQPRENLKIDSTIDSPLEFENFGGLVEDKKIVFSGEEVPRDIADNNVEMSQTPISKVMESFAKSVGKRSVNSEPAENLQYGRKIVNVMVFYSDNSFESFVPDR